MSETPCATVLWTIENFFFCPHDCDESLCSPKFYVESLNQSEWCLKVFPNQDEVKILLQNIYLDERSSLFLDYDLSFLTAENIVLWTGKQQNARIKSFTSYEIDGYPTSEEVYETRKDEYLHKNALKILCRMRKSRKTSTRPITYFVRTHIGIQRRSFDWKVEEFRQLVINERLQALRPEIGEDQPTFGVELTCTGNYENEVNVVIDIRQVKNFQRLWCTCQISVLNAAGSVLKQSKTDCLYFEESEDILSSDFLTGNVLMTEIPQSLVGDVLHLVFDITFSTHREFSSIDHVTDVPRWVLSPNPQLFGIAEQLHGLSLEEAPGPSGDEDRREPVTVLKQDLLSLYMNRKMSDFELRTEDKFFPVHKAVLAARSPVFEAIFSTDMKEKKDNFLEIPDVDGDTLQKLLLFAYTDNVEISDCFGASDLYYAADKYEILFLKQKCSAFLADNISDSNVCSILLLADRHSDKDLKTSVCDFIARNVQIMLSTEWNTFLRSHPLVAAETMQLIYAKKLNMLTKCSIETPGTK